MITENEFSLKFLNVKVKMIWKLFHAGFENGGFISGQM